MTSQGMVGKLELFKFIFNGLLLTFLLFEKKCIAAEITSNIDGLICPGEEVGYTCVSQGTSQRWRLDNADKSIQIEKTYVQGQQTGRPDVRHPFTITLVSSGQGQLTSTVSVLATTSIHNTAVECTGISSRHSIIIGIAGIPTAPTNLQNVVDVYHDYFSTVLFTWDAPTDNSRVDYYQYQVENGTNSLTYNTSNTTAILSEIYYNKNVTFSVFSLNCIGKSSALIQIIHVVGCREFDYYSFNISHSALNFSQAPGTQIVLSCHNMYATNRDIVVTCENDGRWTPDPESSPCAMEPMTTVTMRRNYSTLISEISSIGTSPPSKLGITVTSILVPLCVVTVCTVMGFAGICILLKFILIRKRKKERFTANQVNQTYYEVIDPIYETVPSTKSENLTQDNFGITTMSNDAYTCNIHSQDPETRCCHSPPLVQDFNAASNEAYVPSEIILSMQNNSSYQAASQWQFMTSTLTIGESESPTNCKKHQCYNKQSMENIQQTELLCSSDKI